MRSVGESALEKCGVRNAKACVCRACIRVIRGGVKVGVTVMCDKSRVKGGGGEGGGTRKVVTDIYIYIYIYSHSSSSSS